MKTNMKALLGLLLVALIIAGCGAEAAPLEDLKRSVPIELASMKRDVVEHTYVSVGEVVPNKQVDIYINGNGYIETIQVATGDLVDKDMVLVQLDDSEVDMTNYNATESQLRTVRDNLGSQLRSLNETFEKQSELYSEGIITLLEFDQTKNQIENLERDFSNAKVAYRSQLSLLKTGIDDSAESRIIQSPVEGLVAAVYVKEGQAVTNQMALTIIDDSRLFVRTHVSGDLKKQLAVGDLLRVNLDGDENQQQIGQIHEIDALPDMSNKLFEVLIELTEPGTYVIGDYVEVEFILERYEALLVPTQSVMRNAGDQYVYIFENDLLTKQQIEPGRTSGNWLEVKNIEALAQVVIRGQNQLTANSDFVVIE